MRKIREALRLSRGLGLTARQVAASLGLARSTVAEYVRRAEEAGLSWPLPSDCGDFVLERRLFPPTPLVAAVDRPLPDWTEVARELGRKMVVWFSFRKDLASFLAGHQAAFREYGGLPEAIRPDCLGSAVRIWRGAASALNERYQKYLEPLGVIVLPARPGAPEDKGKIEKRILDLFSLLDLRLRSGSRTGVGDRGLLATRPPKPEKWPIPDFPAKTSRQEALGSIFFGRSIPTPSRIMAAAAKIGMRLVRPLRWLFLLDPVESRLQDIPYAAERDEIKRQGPLASGFDPLVPVARPEPHDPERGPVSLLRMGTAFHEPPDHLRRKRPRAFRPADESLGRPLQVGPMRLRPVLGQGRVMIRPVVPDMRGDPLAPVEDLNRPGRGSDLDLLVEITGRNPAMDDLLD